MNLAPLSCSWAALGRSKPPNINKNLPSCERKAVFEDAFRYLQTFVLYLCILFVQKRLFSENWLNLQKNQ